MIGNIRQLCFRMAKVRHFNTSSIHRPKYTPKENPGVYRRLKVIAEDEPDIKNAGIDYDSIEDLEQDFMQAGEMHDEIMDNMKRISKRQQLQMTERRHFRPPKEPGMLTWSEKEQIRFLRQSDPEKWTAELLAERFPASPIIIKKILKYKWKPENAERLKAHDYKVSENWKSFHKGQLDVNDPRLRAHLAKFTDRKDGVNVVSDEEAAKITEVIMPKPTCTEFLSIITSFKPEVVANKIRLQQEEYYSQDAKQIKNSNPLDMLETSTVSPHLQVRYTLDQYSRKLEDNLNKMNVSSDSPQEIKAIIGIRNQTVAESAPPSEKYVAPSERFKTNAAVYQISKKSPLKLRDPDDLPNRIQIPREVWKQGMLYRVNECFYNDKGYFVYRVPGLKP